VPVRNPGSITLASLACALLATLPAAGAEAPLDLSRQRASDPIALGWMVGTPPPPDKMIRFDDGSSYRFPQWRWTFSHWRELRPTVAVPHGNGPVWPLEGTPRTDLDAVTFLPIGGTTPVTWAQSVEANYTDGIVVLHRGRIVYERYAGALATDRPHIAFSVTKSFVGTLAAMLIAEGALDPTAKVTRYLPELAGSGFGDATVAQVLDMTTALDFVENYTGESPSMEAYRYSTGFAPRPANASGPTSIYSFLPTVAKKGTHGEEFHYRTPNVDVAAWLIARVTGKSAATVLSERIWSRMGAEDDAFLQVDKDGVPLMGTSLNARLRDMARFGELMRLNGRFNGQQIVPVAVVDEIRRGASPKAFLAGGYPTLPGWSYHDFWWVSHDDHGAYMARGIHGQAIYVDPKAEMVIARFASHPLAGNANLDPMSLPAYRAVAEHLMANPQPVAQTLDGAKVYARRCAACHDQTGSRTPAKESLTRLSPHRILRTLDFGLMMSVAYPMSRDEREAVAAYLGKGKDDLAPPPEALCKADQEILSHPTTASWTGWSPRPDNARYQGADGAGLDASRVGKLKLRWAFGFPGDVIAFAAPTVLRGTLFVGSAAGMVQALDARTGCIHWTYQADGPVRTPPTVVDNAGQPVLLFTDQIGGVYGLKALTGQQLWKTRVETHEATRLTGAIAVHEGLAFVPAASWEESRAVDPAYVCCTFRGSVTAVRVGDGSVAWKTWLVDTPRKTGVSAAGTDVFGPSGVGVWSAPTVDAKRGVLYVATGDNYTLPATDLSDAIIAMDLKSGAIVWKQQTLANDVFNATCTQGAKGCGPDYDFASPAMLVRAPGGQDILVAGQKSGVVFGLDPANRGKLLWQTRVGLGGTSGGVQWGMASDGRYAYASVADAVRMQGDLSSAQVGNASFDPAKGGGLTALNVIDGSKRWFAPAVPCAPAREGCSPAQPGSVTAIPGAVFSGSMDGHIRAFSTEDGKLLWDFDTQKSYQTVNGQAAQGGSLDGAGAVVVDGMVYVNSGYPRLGGVPGNVLLAFGLDNSTP
jgi:CubicO group peptidase (beta-lactamase class C family)/outer membrane protein assembly factor BamB